VIEAIASVPDVRPSVVVAENTISFAIACGSAVVYVAGSDEGCCCVVAEGRFGLVGAVLLRMRLKPLPLTASFPLETCRYVEAFCISRWRVRREIIEAVNMV